MQTRKHTEVVRDLIAIKGQRILDVGCGDGALTRFLARNGATATGIDISAVTLQRARSAEAVAGADYVEGVGEKLPFPDASVDGVIYMNALHHVPVEGQAKAIAEAARVLKPRGRMLVYTCFATDLLEPREAAMINGPLGNIPANLDRARVEDAFRSAGLAIERKDVIGTEWREYEEERTRPASRDLLRLARLRRRREEIVEQYGQELYDLAQASLCWLPYLLLGKLQPTMYILKRL